MRAILFLTSAVLAFGTSAMAQDPVSVDPKHYQVVFENEHVRVLRISYGPHEKSVMHEHPAGVGVALTDAQVKFALPGGETADATFKAGEAVWLDAGKHQPESVSDRPLEFLQIELKR